MGDKKIHIDQYFKEKVSSQEVEGQIPDFEDIISKSTINKNTTDDMRQSPNIISKQSIIYATTALLIISALIAWWSTSSDLKKQQDNKTKTNKKEHTSLSEEKKGLTIPLDNSKKSDSKPEKSPDPVNKKQTKRKQKKQNTPTVFNNLKNTEEAKKNIAHKKEEEIIPKTDSLSSKKAIGPKPKNTDQDLSQEINHEENSKKTTEEKATGLDLFMKNHTNKNEKGEQLFKDKK